MFCAISGEIPDEPVVSRKSGHLFEKRVIEKALTATGGKCPETGQDLQSDDLIEVKTSGKATKPIQSSATSFPGLLSNLQSEWDSIMLENHQVKKLLNKTRQELAHALYQYDAATRLIAKVLTEKDELQIALNDSLSVEANKSSKSAPKRKLHETVDTVTAKDPSMRKASNNVPKPLDSDSIPPREAKRLKESTTTDKPPVDENVISSTNGAHEKEVAILPTQTMEDIEKLSKSLRKNRKSRKPSSSLERTSAIETFSSVAKCSGLNELPGSCITYLDGDRVAVGSLNGKIAIMDSTSLDIEETRDAGKSCLTVLARSTESEPYFASGSDDGYVRVWDSAKDGKVRLTERDSSSIVDLFCHPNNKLLFSCSDDGGWAWRDLSDGRIVSLRSGGKHIEEKKRYRSGAIHPDGVLFATGCVSGTTEMWDMRTMKMMTGFETPNIKGDLGVTSLNMSENGYYLLAGVNGTVVIWDLRNQQIAREFKIEESPEPLAVQLDYSGVFGSAVSKNKHALFVTKKKKGGILRECSYDLDESMVSNAWRRPGIVWGPDAKSVIVCHADGAVHRYAKAEES